VIDVRDLRKSYGDFAAVQGIDLAIRPGEIVALLGPNGAGKTTTVEILEGYRKRTAGEVRVLGEDPESAPLLWRDRIGVVLQESEIEPDLTARECLELYAGFHLRPRPVMETLELVGLAEKATVRGSRLSGGQRRRLDVALALIGDPELIFLDEPTTGFDPSARRQAWSVIDGLRSLGKTVLLTTHYMDEAERLADRIVVVAGGRVVAEGTPSTLAGRDSRPAAITFEMPAGYRVETLPEPLSTRASTTDHGKASLVSDRPLTDIATLAAWALQRGVEVHDLEVRQPSLEDIYLELTGGTIR
jgi:ABC-2 type transport system ATP-binding protein